MDAKKTQPAPAAANGRTRQRKSTAQASPSLPELVAPAAFAQGRRGRAPSKGAVSETAKVVRAQKELLHVAELRLAHQAVRSKTSQDALAALLGTSQSTVSRMIKQIVNDPSVLEPGPREIINRRAVGQIDDDAMMKELTIYTYGPNQYDPTGGDGFIRGPWRQIEDALTEGLITDDEYEQIAREAPVTKTARVDR